MGLNLEPLFAMNNGDLMGFQVNMEMGDGSILSGSI